MGIPVQQLWPMMVQWLFDSDSVRVVEHSETKRLQRIEVHYYSSNVHVKWSHSPYTYYLKFYITLSCFPLRCFLDPTGGWSLQLPPRLEQPTIIINKDLLNFPFLSLSQIATHSAIYDHIGVIHKWCQFWSKVGYSVQYLTILLICICFR